MAAHFAMQRNCSLSGLYAISAWLSLVDFSMSRSSIVPKCICCLVIRWPASWLHDMVKCITQLHIAARTGRFGSASARATGPPGTSVSCKLHFLPVTLSIVSLGPSEGEYTRTRGSVEETLAPFARQAVPHTGNYMDANAWM